MLSLSSMEKYTSEICILEGEIHTSYISSAEGVETRVKYLHATPEICHAREPKTELKQAVEPQKPKAEQKQVVEQQRPKAEQKRVVEEQKPKAEQKAEAEQEQPPAEQPQQEASGVEPSVKPKGEHPEWDPKAKETRMDTLRRAAADSQMAHAWAFAGMYPQASPQQQIASYKRFHTEKMEKLMAKESGGGEAPVKEKKTPTKMGKAVEQLEQIISASSSSRAGEPSLPQKPKAEQKQTVEQQKPKAEQKQTSAGFGPPTTETTSLGNQPLPKSAMPEIPSAAPTAGFGPPTTEATSAGNQPLPKSAMPESPSPAPTAGSGPPTAKTTSAGQWPLPTPRPNSQKHREFVQVVHGLIQFTRHREHRCWHTESLKRLGDTQIIANRCGADQSASKTYRGDECLGDFSTQDIAFPYGAT